MCGVTVLPCQKSTGMIGEESDCGKYRQAGVAERDGGREWIYSRLLSV